MRACLAGLVVALVVAAGSLALAEGLKGAALLRNDHVRVWISDPQLMPTRPDGSSWKRDNVAPRLQISIRLKRGTARSKIVSSTNPNFQIAPIDVGLGETVAIQLWELAEIGGTSLAKLEFSAGTKADSIVASSGPVMLLEARTQAVDVWSIDEVSLSVPFRLDDKELAALKSGLVEFHAQLHEASRGQVRMGRFRIYELPTAQQLSALQGRALVHVGTGDMPEHTQGTPAAPAPMAIAAGTLAKSKEVAAQLMTAFKTSLLGAHEPHAAASEDAGSAPWPGVVEALHKDLGLTPLPASLRVSPVAAPEIEVVRPNTLDLGL